MANGFINGRPWEQQIFNDSSVTDFTSWVDASNDLPNAMPGASLVMTPGYVYLMNENYTYRAPITSGVIGSWSAVDWSENQVSESASFVTTTKAYFYGAHNVGGAYQDWIRECDIDASTGALSEIDFATPTPLGSTGVSDGGAFVLKGNAYFYGGRESGSVEVTTVAYAAIDNATGEIGTVYDTGNDLFERYDPYYPDWYIRPVCVVTNSRVYVYSHWGTFAQTDGEYATYTEGGAIGSWSAAPDLPGTTKSPAVLVTKNRVFFFGGSNGVAQDDVYTAPIDSSGVIGTWASGTDLPVAMKEPFAVVTSGRLYLIDVDSQAVYYHAFSGGSDDYSDEIYGQVSEAEISDGDFNAPLSSMSGVGDNWPVVSTGNIDGTSEFFGIGANPIISHGDFNAPLSEMNAAVAIVSVGDFNAPLSTMSGTGVLPLYSWGAMSARASKLSGVGMMSISSHGNLNARCSEMFGVTGDTCEMDIRVSSLSGTATNQVVCFGDMQIHVSSLSGIGKITPVSHTNIDIRVSKLFGAMSEQEVNTCNMNAPMSTMSGTVIPQTIINGDFNVPASKMFGRAEIPDSYQVISYRPNRRCSN